MYKNIAKYLVLQNIQISFLYTKIIQHISFEEKPISNASSTMLQNQSQFDIKINHIQQIITTCNQDSQRIQNDIKRAREQLQQLRNVIENRNTNCLREIEPRIKQLEQKIELYWDGVKKMNQMAWKDLQAQSGILDQCLNFVNKLQENVKHIEARI